MLTGEDSNETYLDEYLDNDDASVQYSLKNTKNADYVYSPGLAKDRS